MEGDLLAGGSARAGGGGDGGSGGRDMVNAKTQESRELKTRERTTRSED